MTLCEMEYLWRVQNEEIDFWEYVYVPENLNKDTLINYLLFEYGDMQTIDSNSGHFRYHIKNFFEVHKWNIDELAETLNYKYDPLADSRWHEHFEDNRDTITDFTQAQDVTTDFTSERDIKTKSDMVDWKDKDIEGEENRTENINEDLKNTYNENETKDMTETLTHGHTIDKPNGNTTTTNYVSAFNLPESPTGVNLRDTEHHRDVTVSDTHENHGGTDTTDTNIKSHNTTGNKNNENTIDKTSHLDYNSYEESNQHNKETKNTDDDVVTKNVVDDNIVNQTVLDDGVIGDTFHHGNNTHTFQSLIKEEREQGEFNIYKWIGRHFSLELLICLW